MSEIGKGRYNSLYPEVNELGKSLSYQYSIRDKRLPPRRIQTIGGVVTPRNEGADEIQQPTSVKSRDLSPDFYLNFTDYEKKLKAEPQTEGDKSFSLHFEDRNMQDAFKLTYEKFYRPTIKKEIARHAPKFGDMKAEAAEKYVNENMPKFIRNIFGKPSLGFKDSGNPFKYVLLKQDVIKGLKLTYPKNEISFTVAKWNKVDPDQSHNDKFALLMQGRLYDVYPDEKETLRSEEFMLTKIARLVIQNMYKNWNEIN